MNIHISEESPEDIGRRLKERRELLQLSVKKMESLMGIGHLYIEALESGDYSIFKNNASEVRRCLKLYAKKINLEQLSSKPKNSDQGIIDL